jgi:YebC/PmpR family DNA-binding regulatory protein
MGRAFEKRKHKKFARWGKIAKAFTRIGKEIAIAAKQGGPDPDTNPRLRMAMQNAKGVSMPKDRIEAAIKRATNRDEKDYEEVVYEGYGPYGVAIVVECATDNNTRTVANVRSYFNKANGSLGKTGSLDFLFERKGVFKIDGAGIDEEEMELELIDAGIDEIERDEEGFYYAYCVFEDFGPVNKALESKSIKVITSELQRIPLSYVDVTPEQEEELMKLIDRIEEDDDVNFVFHNMKLD